MKRFAALLLATPALLLAPPAVSPYVLLPQAGQSLPLFLDYQNNGQADSSTTGSMCVNADGDETCAFDVLLTMQSDTGVFASFTPAAGGIVGRIDPGTQKTLRVNGVNVNGMAIPAAIGTLVVDAAGAKQLQIQVAGRHRVGAAGQLDAIQNRVIVNLPEPGRDWLLGSGLLGLALLARLRRRALAAGA